MQRSGIPCPAVFVGRLLCAPHCPGHRTDPGLSPAAEPLRAQTDGGCAAVCVVVGSRKGCGTGSTVEAGGALRAGLWMKSRPPRQKDVKGPGEAVPGGGARPGGRGPW